MPNWITNYVEITGEPEKLAELVAKTIKPLDDGEGVYFDFNGIIPMPEELSITSGSQTDMGMACFNQQKFDQYRQYPWFAESCPNVETPAQLKDVLDEQIPEAVALGQQAMDNLAKYDAPTWYQWCNREWGTKWNTHDTEVIHQSDTALVVRFDTAWSSPTPIFDELVEQGFTVNCVWQDEDPSNEGTYGEPYEVFDINQPPVEVSYWGDKREA